MIVIIVSSLTCRTGICIVVIAIIVIVAGVSSSVWPRQTRSQSHLTLLSLSHALVSGAQNWVGVDFLNPRVVLGLRDGGVGNAVELEARARVGNTSVGGRRAEGRVGRGRGAVRDLLKHRRRVELEVEGRLGVAVGGEAGVGPAAHEAADGVRAVVLGAGGELDENSNEEAADDVFCLRGIGDELHEIVSRQLRLDDLVVCRIPARRCGRGTGRRRTIFGKHWHDFFFKFILLIIIIMIFFLFVMKFYIKKIKRKGKKTKFGRTQHTFQTVIICLDFSQLRK